MFADWPYNLIPSCKLILQATILNLKHFTSGDEPLQGFPN